MSRMTFMYTGMGVIEYFLRGLGVRILKKKTIILCIKLKLRAIQGIRIVVVELSGLPDDGYI